MTSSPTPSIDLARWAKTPLASRERLRNGDLIETNIDGLRYALEKVGPTTYRVSAPLPPATAAERAAQGVEL